jgi:1,2-phenylacetyl-CoA epoxidase PaaB subunit
MLESIDGLTSDLFKVANCSREPHGRLSGPRAVHANRMAVYQAREPFTRTAWPPIRPASRSREPYGRLSGPRTVPANRMAVCQAREPFTRTVWVLREPDSLSREWHEERAKRIVFRSPCGRTYWVDFGADSPRISAHAPKLKLICPVSVLFQKFPLSLQGQTKEE